MNQKIFLCGTIEHQSLWSCCPKGNKEKSKNEGKKKILSQFERVKDRGIDGDRENKVKWVIETKKKNVELDRPTELSENEWSLDVDILLSDPHA